MYEFVVCARENYAINTQQKKKGNEILSALCHDFTARDGFSLAINWLIRENNCNLFYFIEPSLEVVGGRESS